MNSGRRAIATKKARQRIVERIERLAEDPRPVGCRKMSGQERYRIRQGNYRIIYAIEAAMLAVYIVMVGHRSSVYR